MLSQRIVPEASLMADMQQGGRTFLKRFMQEELRSVEREALRSSRSYHLLLGMGLPPAEIRMRLITELTALGVVSALLASLSFNVLSAPPSDLLLDDRAAAAYCILSGTCILCNLACVSGCTLFITSFNLATDELMAWYVRHYVNIVTGCCFQFFNVGVVSMAASVCMFVYFRYSAVAAWIVVAIAVVALLIVSVVYLWVDYARFFKLRDLFKYTMAEEGGSATKAKLEPSEASLSSPKTHES